MDIHIYLRGDVMIGRSFNELFSYNPNFNIWGNTAKYAPAFINLETTITDNKKKFPDKTFNFKLSPKYADILKKTGVKYANLANNHSMDFMEKGLLDTIKILDNMGILHTGAGKNITEAQKPTIFEYNNIKIGIISSADHPANFIATTRKAGINYVDMNNRAQRDKQIALIKNIRPYVDILIYSIHYGSNYVDRIPRETIDFFHELVDSGVDVIHGHSAHHILPIERYKSSYIIYSNGDFIDDYSVDPSYRNDLSFITNIQIDQITKKISTINIIPTKITIKHENGILHPQVNTIEKSDPDYNFVIRKNMWKYDDKLGGMQPNKTYYDKYLKYKTKYIRLKLNLHKI